MSNRQTITWTNDDQALWLKNQNTKLFIHENTLENACKMAAIFAEGGVHWPFSTKGIVADFLPHKSIPQCHSTLDFIAHYYKAKHETINARNYGTIVKIKSINTRVNVVWNVWNSIYQLISPKYRIYASVNQVGIGSDNCLSPFRRHVII